MVAVLLVSKPLHMMLIDIVLALTILLTAYTQSVWHFAFLIQFGGALTNL